MKLKVERAKDDLIEILTLVLPVTVEVGPRLTLHCGDGTDHYFNEDGCYDGWGRMISGNVDLPPQAGMDLALDIASQREIEDGEPK